MHTPYPKILNGGGISVLFFISVVEKSQLFTSDFMFKALASLKLLYHNIENYFSCLWNIFKECSQTCNNVPHELFDCLMQWHFVIHDMFNISMFKRSNQSHCNGHRGITWVHHLLQLSNHSLKVVILYFAGGGRGES